MSRQTEKFNRAFQRYLMDNPNIDLDKTKEDFIEMYNSGEYKLEDDYEKAEDLYIEAMNSNDKAEAIALLKKAISICPNHFEAQAELYELEGLDNLDVIFKLENLLTLAKEDLVNKGVDFDNIENTLWLINDARPYLRIMNSLTQICIFFKKYDKSLELSKEMLRLDKDDNLDQKTGYFVSLIGLSQFEKAEKDAIENYNNTFDSNFLFFSFLSKVLANKTKLAKIEFFKLIEINSSFAWLISGLASLSKDDYDEILANEYVTKNSFEEAAITIYKLGPIIIDNASILSDFFEKYNEEILEKIIPSKDYIEILFILLTSSSIGIDKLISKIKSLTKDMDFAQLKNKNKEDIKKYLNDLEKMNYINRDGTKYSVSYLGNSLINFITGDDFNENN